MHKLLRLQHHKHTGKKLPHSQTSFHGLFFLFIIGMFFIAAVNRVTADNLDVSAKVSAVLPTQPAVTDPSLNNLSVSADQIAVNGSCEVTVPALIITIWRGDTLLGSTVCSPLGLFSVNVQLINGQNIIYSKIENITSDFGPDGQNVSITFRLPVPISSSGSNGISKITPAQQQVSNADEQLPLQLVSQSDFISIVPNQEMSFTFEIKDGDSPYSLSVNWGDGTNSNYNYKSPGIKTIKHIFNKLISSSIILKITDKNGKVVTLVLGVSTSLPFTPALTSLNGKSVYRPSRLTYIVAGYIFVGSSLIGLWIFHIVNNPSSRVIKRPSKRRVRVKK